MNLRIESQPHHDLSPSTGLAQSTDLAHSSDLAEDSQVHVRRRSARLAAERACGMVAPVFDIRDMVAVNPFVGHADTSFSRGLAAVEQAIHDDLLPALDQVRSWLSKTEFTADDYEAALEASEVAPDAPRSFEELVQELKLDRASPCGPRTLCVADQALNRRGQAVVNAPLTSLTNYLASRMDVGVATSRSASSDLGIYEGYLEYASVDLSVEWSGLSGYRALLAKLPRSADECLALLSEQLPADQELVDYFSRLLARLGGYAGYLRGRGWVQQEHPGAELLELLVVLLAQDYALSQIASVEFGPLFVGEETGWRRDRALRLVALGARERRYSEEVAGAFTAPVATERPRPEVQALFCIDVRSERIRRGFEAEGVETYGFAGFFGLPMASREEGELRPHCPPLLAPSFSASRERIAKSGVLGPLKSSSLSSLTYVEAWGVGALLRLLLDQVAGGDDRRLRHGEQVELQLDSLTLEQRTEMARGILKNSSLEKPYAKRVVFVGHGSTVSNNPQAASYACGACAGHSGALNARVAAALCNDSEVRERLVSEGWELQDDTQFVAAVHDTATDEVRVLSSDHVQVLAPMCEQAGQRARTERAIERSVRTARPSLRQLRWRSRDPAEVQHEWGLTKNAAFVIGRRGLTQANSLDGRSFLHSYEPDNDEDGSILRMILTAPAVVGSWINLQYYASTVAPGIYGSGQKTLHNVVGGFGVVEGGSGDLAVGLPIESVSTHGQAQHEPIRLQVFVESPRARIDKILAEEESIRQLVAGEWITVHAVDPQTREVHRVSLDR